MKESNEEQAPLEIAVVGGGIAGLYCCYRLSKQAGRSIHITLYESSTRLGGRIETWRIRRSDKPSDVRDIHIPELMEENRKDGVKNLSHKLPDTFVAEFGPMRIEPEQQPYLNKLLQDLNVTPFQDGNPEAWYDLVPFPSYQSEAPRQPVFALEGEEAEQTTLIDLLLLALRHIFESVSVKRDKADVTDAPWQLAGSTSLPVNYDEANFYWKEFRKEHELNRRFWKGFLQNWIDLLEDDHYEVIRRHFEFRGVPLYAMGFWNLLGSVLSHMAVMKLRDWGSFYHLLPENPNAAEWIIFWLRAIKSSDSLVGIRGGMDWIVARLCQELGLVVAKADDAGLLEPNERGELRYTEGGPHCDLRLRHKLKEVREDANGVTLVFKNGEKEIVEVKKLDHVILAMPKAPLQKIHYQGKAEMVSEFCQDLDSVFAFPLLKCFFVIDKPFWEDNRKPNTYAAHVPTRELHWWKSRDKTLGMSMLYTDRPGTQFWADYLTDQHLADKNRKQIQAKVWRWSTNEVDSKYLRKGDKFENERLLRTFLLYAREKSSEYVTASRLIAAGMRDWGLMPYGGACHAWRSGSQSWEVRKRLKCFSLWDKSRGSIHVCGEAYSDYQGFIEGSLRSARDILVLDNEPFNISDEDLLPTGYNDRALPRSRRPSQR